MSRWRRGRLVPLGVALLVALVAVIAVAAESGLLTAVYDLGWWTVDGGGGRLSGEGYVLQSTAGQADAGRALVGGDKYTLQGGFWPGGAAEVLGGHPVYLPLVRRG